MIQAVQAAKFQLATILAFGLLLAGCASESTRPDAPASGTQRSPTNSAVEKRALERWSYLIERKADKAYDFLTPGYRATKSRETYASEMNNRPIHWTKVYPYSETCEKPDVCVLNIQIDADTAMPGVGKKVPAMGFVAETWIRTRGKWYFLPDAKQGTGG